MERPSTTRPSKRRPIVLTVDDNLVVHDVYGLAFEKDYEHLRAYCGREALKIVRSRVVDVMVLDLVMPGLNGLEVLERVFKLLPRRPILIVSSVVIDVCISNRHLVSCTILLGHATTGQPRGAGATATARD